MSSEGLRETKIVPFSRVMTAAQLSGPNTHLGYGEQHCMCMSLTFMHASTGALSGLPRNATAITLTVILPHAQLGTQKEMNFC